MIVDASSIAPGVAAILLTLGTACIMAGAIGLVRFPDVVTRLHALTKADNLGLALIACGSVVLAPSLAVALKAGLIWVLLTAASATAAHLIARHAAAQTPAPHAQAPGDASGARRPQP